MCRHHLLLPDVATRRDLDDEATINAVAAAVGSTEVLELLAALTEADSLATGPAAWSQWKARLVRQLVAAGRLRAQRPRRARGAEAAARRPFPTPGQRALLAAGRQQIVTEGDRLTRGRRRPAAACSAGWPACWRCTASTCSSASAATEGGVVAAALPWCSRASGRPSRGTGSVDDLERALAGQLAIPARLAAAGPALRRAAPRRRGAAATSSPRCASTSTRGDATVVEVHAPDGMGVLYRITRALADLDLDITFATVQTLGPQVVDTFYVRGQGGAKVTDAGLLAEAERALLHALATPV